MPRVNVISRPWPASKTYHAPSFATFETHFNKPRNMTLWLDPVYDWPKRFGGRKRKVHGGNDCRWTHRFIRAVLRELANRVRGEIAREWTGVDLVDQSGLSARVPSPSTQHPNTPTPQYSNTGGSLLAIGYSPFPARFWSKV
jgi:hypothetical protein